MPIIGPGGVTRTPVITIQTIGEVFASKGLWQFWNQNGGQGTNPFDGVSEKGIDYSNAFGTPIGVPVGGTVVRVAHNTNSIGAVVELQAIDGSVWLYQHMTSSARPGDVLFCGDVIGTENGLPRDQYSTGPHIEVRYCKPGTWKASIDSWDEPWVNPYGVFSTLSNQSAGSVGSGNYTQGGNFTIPLLSHLAPDVSVADFFEGIDTALALTNPFDLACHNETLDTIGIGPVQAPNPVTWVTDVTSNILQDSMALIMRFLLVLIGAFILIKVLSNFIDFGTLAESGINVAKTAALL